MNHTMNHKKAKLVGKRTLEMDVTGFHAVTLTENKDHE